MAQVPRRPPPDVLLLPRVRGPRGLQHFAFMPDGVRDAVAVARGLGDGLGGGLGLGNDAAGIVRGRAHAARGGEGAERELQLQPVQHQAGQRQVARH